MRVVYIDPHPVPGEVTEALQILQMVDAFGRCGAEVELISPRAAYPREAAQILGHPLSERVQIHTLPNPRNQWWFPSGSNRPFFWLVTRLLRMPSDQTVDALFVRNLKLAAHLLRQPPGSMPPLFFDAHELFANSYREEHRTLSLRKRRKLAKLAATETLVYQRASALFCTTPKLLEDIRTTYRITTPAWASPLGYDAQLARQAACIARRPRNTPPVLLFLGNPHPWKGVGTLLEAMVEVEGAILKIVGGGGARHDALLRQARALGVSDRVRLARAVPPAQRFQVIASADICLVPLSKRTIASRYTSPLKVFEYMAMGKPIVATDLPSIRLLLEPGKHALLAEAENPASFAQAIRTLLQTPHMAERLAKTAQQHAQRYTWEKRAEKILVQIQRHGREPPCSG